MNNRQPGCEKGKERSEGEGCAGGPQREGGYSMPRDVAGVSVAAAGGARLRELVHADWKPPAAELVADGS